MDSLNSTRDALDNGARSLAGEQVAQPMDMTGSATLGGAAELPAPEVNDFDSEDDDGFAATDAAAGDDELGRERR